MVASDDEHLYSAAHQQVRNGSLSGANVRLTQPGLYASNPVECFLDIHRYIDLSSLSLHMDTVQGLRDTGMG